MSIALSPTGTRISTDNLTALVTRLFAAAGMEAGKAEAVARILVLTDMMGRRTHGVAQCDAYLTEVAKGRMAKAGAPEVVKDTGGTLVWDGHYLPGLWLVEQAMATGFERLAEHGTFTFAMRRSHHIGCLAALAKAATDRGCFVTLASSGPHSKIVAPYGGKEALFSPNPFAFGIPTGATPMLVDICASITTVSMTREKAAAGEQFEKPWLLDKHGKPTCDPTVMESKTDKGSLMLLGGEDYGHKGFGLALMVEALTQGLAGYGRRDAPGQWGASVYMQLIDPGAFSGREAFLAQMDFLADRCRANAPIDLDRPVRLPGDQAARGIAEAQARGISLTGKMVESLRDWAGRLGVEAAV